MGGNDSKMEPKKTFRDDYEVGEKLGEGAFGVVHEVVQIATGERYAAKLIDRAFADASDMERETTMLRSLEHTNIVRCVDVFTDQCFCYIVMVKYPGGDLVDGLQGHLQTRGKIPEMSTLPVLKQMMSAIAFIHSKGVIHRDVKGDNFLMDRPDIVDPDCLVALSDFGTAVHLEKGVKLSEHTGTSIFWSPEVINKHYEFLADVWAVGIVFFGLLDGTFPFRDAKQILQKALRKPKVSKPCLQLLFGILEKDPNKRFSAEKCLNDPWILSGSKKEEKEEKKEAEAAPKAEAEAAPKIENLKVEGVNEAIAQRRQQLVRQLEATHGQDGNTTRQSQAQMTGQKSNKGGGASQPPPVTGNTQNAQNAQNFQIDGVRPQEKIFYEWCEMAECTKRNIQSMNTDGAKALDLSVDDASPESIKEILVRHGVDTSRFGFDAAKTLGDFVRECLRGEAVLAVDSAKLIRVVDVVIVRITDVKEGTRLLVEKSHEFSDKRIRQVNRLPGTKRRPYESVKGTAVRVVSTMIQLPAERVEWIGAAEQYEEMEMSPSYPGIETVYRKYVMKGYINTTDRQTLESVGLPKHKDFRKEKGDLKESSIWGWLNQKQCTKLGIKTTGNNETSRFHGLAPVKVNQTAEGVSDMMKKHGIDTSLYGEGEAYTLDEIAREVQMGECDLMEDKDRGLVRIVSVVLLRVREPKGKILVEARKRLKGGTELQLDRMPGGKQRPHENAFHTARRILTNNLQISEDVIEFNVAGCALMEEEKESHAFPGLKTVYKKHIVDAAIGTPTASPPPPSAPRPSQDKTSKIVPLS